MRHHTRLAAVLVTATGLLASAFFAMAPSASADPTATVTATGDCSQPFTDHAYSYIAITATADGLSADTSTGVHVGGPDVAELDQRASVTGATDAQGNLSVTGSATDQYGPGTQIWTAGETYSWAIDGDSGTAYSGTLMLQDCPSTAPVAVNDTFGVDGTTPQDLDVLANDTDADGDKLLIGLVMTPDCGNVEVITADPNKVRFTAPSDSSTVCHFGYEAFDGSNYSNTATVTVNINRLPVASDDSYIVVKNTPTTLSVLQNDSDPNGDSLTVTSVTQPAHGTAAINGSSTKVLYAPATGYTGNDQFTYTVSDGNGGTDTGTVSILVNAPSPTLVTPHKPRSWYGTGKNAAFLFYHCAKTPGVKYMVHRHDCSGFTLKLSPTKGFRTATVVPRAKRGYQLNRAYAGWKFVNVTKIIQFQAWVIEGNGKENIDTFGVKVDRTKVHVLYYRGKIGHPLRRVAPFSHLLVGQHVKVVVVIKPRVHHLVFGNWRRSMVALNTTNRG